MIVAETDTIAPIGPALRVADRAPKSQLQPQPRRSLWPLQGRRGPRQRGACRNRIPASTRGAFVCKLSDCAGHRFVVLFDANGAQAFGALGGKDNDAAFFGRPSPAEQEATARR
jgi:hypothetical protein